MTSRRRENVQTTSLQRYVLAGKNDSSSNINTNILSVLYHSPPLLKHSPPLKTPSFEKFLAYNTFVDYELFFIGKSSMRFTVLAALQEEMIKILTPRKLTNCLAVLIRCAI